MNSKLFQKTLGIVGGGQLGKMLLSECNKMNINTHVLDPNDNSPCKKMTNKFHLGDFKDFDTVLNFGKECDLITFEIEHINVDALEKLEALGKKVYPSSDTLRVIQDKYKQKCFFKDHNIPTANFKFFENIQQLNKSIDNNEIKFPCVWKKTKFGYDGFGVKILKSVDDIIDLPQTEMIIEDLVAFDKELSIIVARSESGEIKCFKTVEMEFNSDSNQVEFIISPAKISKKIDNLAQELAIKLVKSLNCVGLLAVEMFLHDDTILINELAPRPHNSGHLTIEACQTSQFQQHIRSIFNLKLGETTQNRSAVMLNLVGEDNYSGGVLYENLDIVFNIKEANLHIYGKRETRPNRKMGHITIICNNFDEAYENAKLLKSKIKVKS